MRFFGTFVKEDFVVPLGQRGLLIDHVRFVGGHDERGKKKSLLLDVGVQVAHLFPGQVEGATNIPFDAFLYVFITSVWVTHIHDILLLYKFFITPKPIL